VCTPPFTLQFLFLLLEELGPFSSRSAFKVTGKDSPWAFLHVELSPFSTLGPFRLRSCGFSFLPRIFKKDHFWTAGYFFFSLYLPFFFFFFAGLSSRTTWSVVHHPRPQHPRWVSHFALPPLLPLFFFHCSPPISPLSDTGVLILRNLYDPSRCLEYIPIGWGGLALGFFFVPFFFMVDYPVTSFIFSRCVERFDHFVLRVCFKDGARSFGSARERHRS